MIHVNLLPWRELRRRERKRAFVGFLMLAALLGGCLVVIVTGLNARQLAAQLDRNNLLKAENLLLDLRIKEIASLREDIEALKARQTAVETLQANRNQPVYLLDELASLVPAGVALKSIRQTDSITLTGYAQSNARVSEFLRKLGTQAHWLVNPELIEIKSASLGQGKDSQKIFEFTLNIRLASKSQERP